MTTKLDELRAKVTDDQQWILKKIWGTYCRSNGSSWPTVHEVQIELEKPRVVAAVEALPAGTIHVENDQYRMGLLGALLLTPEGSMVEEFLPLYLGSMKQADHALVYFNPDTIFFKLLKHPFRPRVLFVRYWEDHDLDRGQPDR